MAVKANLEIDEGIREYLEATAAMEQRQSIEGRHYHGYHELVLKEGFAFELAPFPADMVGGLLGHCFSNAFNLSMRNPELAYCEGFAVSMIPVLHAWCVTLDGRVVDPTWTPSNEVEGLAYFGVPLADDYVRRVALTTKKFGVLDRWEEGFPILSVSKEIWLHEGWR